MTDTVIPGVGKDARTLVGEDGTKQADLPYAFQHLDPQALFAMANVMYEGNKKYGPPADNWRKIPVEDHLNHMISHAYAWLAGDRSDDHLAHMACRAMGALQVELTKRKKLEDLPTEEFKVEGHWTDGMGNDPSFLRCQPGLCPGDSCVLYHPGRSNAR